MTQTQLNRIHVFGFGVGLVAMGVGLLLSRCFDTSFAIYSAMFIIVIGLYLLGTNKGRHHG